MSRACFRGVLGMALVAILPACGDPKGSDSGARLIPGGADVVYPELVPAGESLQAGIFDPALAYDPEGNGWLAYSSIQGPLGTAGPYVHTHLARSRDRGASWTHVGVINASFDGTLEYFDGTKRGGVWRAEVPTIVFDPGDPGREMYLHRYFWWNAAPPGVESRLWDYGWIALRHAPAPTGPWSEEVALFAAGASPRSPYHQQRIDLNALHPDLADVGAYSEPGALVRDGVLYLSLVAGRAVDPTIVLIASDDHGETWRYVATLVTTADARGLGYLRFDSSSLVQQGGETLLMATPVTEALLNDGALFVPFADLAAGRLRRNADGSLWLRVHVPLQRSLLNFFGGGQATYHKGNVNGGVVFPQLDTRDSRWYRIFSTGVLLGH